ncbi:hypothetical protein AYO43_02590 [Nitrospira sp. SCGC AG-212-E16]|nr:hypothetical protein AYO43_02590 [Nitrospira sp. SCGC AG-212-E16]
MPSDPRRAALTTPGHLRFPTNLLFAQDLEQVGGRVSCQVTGHLVFYRPDGRRFLATDPEGNPLHECEWGTDSTGEVTLLRARIRLDWGQWVGLKPAGLVNETNLNLASKPGWQRLTADDLRTMATQALRVPLEEVRFFYRDEDLLIEPTGTAMIRQRKDALYVLQDGEFERARFMSCMGAMHWPSIDFLPVVELFKSLLPGTGSAVFELIRGLYDDQNGGTSTPRPLRYRGIPTYPSEAAFRLFSSFFTPQAPDGSNPFTLFMNPERSHRVIWLPAGTPPIRYFDERAGACLTLQGGVLHKVTMASDSAGLSYMSPKGHRFVPCDRSAEIAGAHVILKDRDRETALAVTLPQERLEQSGEPVAMSPVDWRSVFVHGVPPIPPADAYGAVLLYPDDESEIDECSAQPFVADYVQDIGEQDREIGMVLSRAQRVLIENGDAVVATCITFDRLRDYTVLVRHPAFAQKQAQRLWSICAELQRWDWLSHVRFVPHQGPHDGEAPHSYDVVYHWVPYESGDLPASLAERMKRISRSLHGGGTAFVIGPAQLGRYGASDGLQVCWEEPVEQLPTFRMHRTILPKARLRAGLTVFYFKKV